VTSQINTLKEEHRIFRRTFILNGNDYLLQMKADMDYLEDAFEKDYFVDESGTAGVGVALVTI